VTWPRPLFKKYLRMCTECLQKHDAKFEVRVFSIVGAIII